MSKSMCVHILIAGATIAAIVFVSNITVTREADPSVSVVGGNMYNAGAVRPGSAVVHVFTLANPHPYAMGLTTALPGCACTTAAASASSVPAHGRATVTLRVEPEDGQINGSAEFATTRGIERVETVLFVTGRVQCQASPHGLRTKL